MHSADLKDTVILREKRICNGNIQIEIAILVLRFRVLHMQNKYLSQRNNSSSQICGLFFFFVVLGIKLLELCNLRQVL